MLIECEHGSIEVAVGADDYVVSLSVDRFSGANARLSVDPNALRRFVNDLERLVRERQGEALLSATSPGTFDLAIRITDRLGHVVSAAAVVGRGRHEGGRFLKSNVSAEFGIDPAKLPRILHQAKALLP